MATFEEIVEKYWPDIKARFWHPLVLRDPELVDSLHHLGTAYFNLANHDLKISRRFLDVLKEAGIQPEVSILGLLTHELGHYVIFPRELSTVLFLGQVAEEKFKEKGAAILNIYDDVVDNLDSLSSDRRGGELAELYRGIIKLSDGQDRLDRLLISLYQEITERDFGIKSDESRRGRLARLKRINYFHPRDDEYAHAANLATFGEIIQSLVPENPHLCINIDHYGNEELNRALDDIVKRHSKYVYERVKRYLKTKRPDFIDPNEEAIKKITTVKLAGTEGILGEKIEWNDDQVPYYKRLASTYGIYIARKPMSIDIRDNFPAENVTYDVGDELTKVNIWSSPTILPGITKKWKDSFGRKPELRYKIPDLFALLDSSASMPHPRYMSYAVLASFIVARNYHINGAKVGLMNFSSDALLIPPTRDIDMFYHGATAYWGGGTVLNIDEVKDFLTRLGKGEELGVEVTTEADYRKLIDELTPEERKQYEGGRQQLEEKRLKVKLDPLAKAYEKLDSFLITDGGIWNIEELVGYLNSIAVQTRNTVILAQSPEEYKRWSELELRNTTLYHVEDPKDLVGIAIGKAKAVANTTSELGYWRS